MFVTRCSLPGKSQGSWRNVARKQWAKVAEALAANPEDAAIIEGYAALDARVEGIAVYATSATTKRLQAAKRAATL